MSIRLDERRYAEELKRLVADFRMWKNPLVPLPDGFEDDLVWRSAGARAWWAASPTGTAR